MHMRTPLINLKSALGVLVVWLCMTGNSMAGVFICWNFSTYYSPAPGFVSDGAGGGKFLVQQNPAAGQVIYQGTLTSSASCANTDGAYRIGQWMVYFGNVPVTFAGGGLQIAATAAPAVTVPINAYCHLRADPWPWLNQATATLWNSTGLVVGMGTNTSNGCIVSAVFPVRVTATGSPVVAGAGVSTYMQAVAYDGGSWSGPAVTVSALTTACAVTPSVSTVNLPGVSQQALKNAGDTTGVQLFSITLTGCSALATGAYLAKATWSFTQGAMATTIANSATSPAANVEIQIRDANNTPVANNAVTTIATGITGGTHVANFSARYYATGQATAGNVRGVATFNVSYQ